MHKNILSQNLTHFYYYNVETNAIKCGIVFHLLERRHIKVKVNRKKGKLPLNAKLVSPIEKSKILQDKKNANLETKIRNK